MEAHHESGLFVDKRPKDSRHWLHFRSRFQSLKPLREIDDLIQIVHSAGRIFLAKSIASLEDVAEREGHAFVLDQVV